ncbi:MAG: ABC transporter ATP-binding protein [Treponema sp.]|nr:ABC transporter ATP-binding protein [Treponema sp.]
MNFLELKNLSFAYPPVEGDVDENGKQIVPPIMWEHISFALPGGFVHLVGPNGCGKSTFLLLASGRLMPTTGSVLLLGQNPNAMEEEQRNLLASFIYQNMEFETDEKVESLLHHVYQNGALKGNAPAIREGHTNLLSEVTDLFELGDVLNHPLTGLSKGEIQRVLLAFSILYGSKSIFMDEPMFAMELPQKEKCLAYLRDFVKKTGTTIYISMHELDLTRKYAELVLLMYPNHDMDLGTPDEVLTNEDLEKAYGVPASMLKSGEEYTRTHLKEMSDLLGPRNSAGESK